MGTVIEVCNKVEEAVKGFLPMLENKLSSHTEDFEENIRIQLYAGKNGNGNDLQPNYLNDPYFAMQQMYKTSKKRKQKNKEQRAREYRDWKLKSTPPDSSNRLGLPSRNPNTPNLIIRGDFYHSIKANVGKEGIYIYSAGFYAANDIENKYSRAIFKMGKENISWVLKNILIPSIDEYFKKYGL